MRLLAETADLDLTSLRAKLELALNALTEPSRLEINAEEAEAILDALPTPEPNQIETELLLREKLRQFLSNDPLPSVSSEN